MCYSELLFGLERTVIVLLFILCNVCVYIHIALFFSWSELCCLNTCTSLSKRVKWPGILQDYARLRMTHKETFTRKLSCTGRGQNSHLLLCVRIQESFYESRLLSFNLCSSYFSSHNKYMPQSRTQFGIQYLV